MFKTVHILVYIWFHCIRYSLAVFVARCIVVDWNSRLIFTLHQPVAILSHKLKTYTYREETDYSEVNDILLLYVILCCFDITLTAKGE